MCCAMGRGYTLVLDTVERLSIITSPLGAFQRRWCWTTTSVVMAGGQNRTEQNRFDARPSAPQSIRGGVCAWAVACDSTIRRVRTVPGIIVGRGVRACTFNFSGSAAHPYRHHYRSPDLLLRIGASTPYPPFFFFFQRNVQEKHGLVTDNSTDLPGDN